MALKTYKKKAQSEMVSYILLIVIAMGLAVGVYAWINWYVVPGEEREKCSSDVSLSIEDYNCWTAPDTSGTNEKYFTMKLKNNGLFNVSGFFIKASNDTSQLPIVQLKTSDTAIEQVIPGTYYFSEPAKAGQMRTTNFSYTADIDSIKRVRVQPFVLHSKTGTILLCENYVDITIEGCG